MSDYWNSQSSPILNNSESSIVTSLQSEPPVAAYPPRAVLVGIAGLVVVVALLFLFDADVVHSVGYVLGAFGTAVGVVLYRHLDLVRRRNPAYVPRPGFEFIATSLLVSGIVLGMIHVYFALQETAVR